MDAHFGDEARRIFPFLGDPATRLNPAWRTTFSQGSLLLVTGDVCSSVLLVVTGRLRVYQVSGGGRELTLYHVTAGESCVLMLTSVLAQRGYPACAMADTDGVAVGVPVRVFRSWTRTGEAVQQFVYDTLHGRLARMMTLVHEIAFARMDARIAAYVLARTDFDRPQLNVRHEDIASELGTAREVVTRILNQFERDSLVATSRGSLTVLDRKRLQNLCVEPL